MRIPLAVLVLVCITGCIYAATTPGTIVTTSATATYNDSSGQQMPQQTSNVQNVLVVSKNPARTVYTPIRSLYYGPSTVGRVVKLVGTVYTDQNGTWLEDGSVKVEKGANGKYTTTKLRCKISNTFVSPTVLSQQTGRTVITGISQIDTDGVPIVIPSEDIDVQPLE